MQEGTIVRPALGRKTSAGVNLEGLTKCKVVQYIGPICGEQHAVLELEVLEGYSTAKPKWCSRNHWGYSAWNQTLGFNSSFKQPANLNPGTRFRVFASAFIEVPSSKKVASSQPADNTSYMSTYVPPDMNDINTILALMG